MNRNITIEVKLFVPGKITNEKARRLVKQMLDIGWFDASDTIGRLDIFDEDSPSITDAAKVLSMDIVSVKVKGPIT